MITALTLLFVNLGNLTMISSFASATFLLIFAAINLAALRLRARIGIAPALPLAGLTLAFASWLVLGGYLWLHDRDALTGIALSYLAIAIAEFLFSERRLLFKRP